MKKYLITSAAALVLGGLFTGCTHDLDYDGGSAAQNSVIKTYEQAFKTAFGQPDPNNEWGFGSSSTKAATRSTRADMFGFTIPTNPTFKSKTNITKPGVITKPTIGKENATVIAKDQTVSLGYNINNNIYLESGATLRLPEGASFQNINVYMSSGSRLEAQGDLNISGSTNFVNDGGTIIIGSDQNKKGLWTNNFGGIFWNNGTLTVSNELGTSNDGGTFYNGSQGNITAINISFNKDVELWNEGTITLSGDLTTSACDNVGHRFYNSGNISANNISLNKTVTLWTEGGSITARELFTCINNNVNIYIGSGSTISIGGDLDLYNNNQLIVNEGTLNINGDILERNNEPEIVNYGTLTGASLELLAGAKFHNTGTATISGMTHIANSQTKWKNEGTFITEDFNITDYAVMIWNCCKMIVHKTNNTGEFKIYGEFVLDAGASIVTDKVNWINKSNVYMKDLSLFKVEGDFISNNYDSGCGIHSCGDNWAVIKVGAMKQYNDTNDQFRMSYYGNLWVDAASHFELWYKDGPSNTNQPNYKFFGSATFGHEGDEGCPVIPVANTGDRNYSCTPGYNTDGDDDDDDDDDDPNAIVIRVICEDLTVNDPKNDFDFNDAVFDVKLIDNKVDITLRAAGGTLPLYIGDDAKENEIHYAFETTNHKGITTGTMLTTETPRKTPHKYNLVSCLTAKLSFDLNQKPEWLTGWSEGDGAEAKVKTVAKNIPVLVRKLVNQEYTLVELQCEKGKATAKVGIKLDPNNEFKWCDERVNINDTFSYEDALGNSYGGFTFYVQGFLSENEWYQYNGVLTDDMVRRYLGQ